MTKIKGEPYRDTAMFMSLGKTEAERRRKAKLMKKRAAEDAEKAARKRGIIGVRG